MKTILIQPHQLYKSTIIVSTTITLTININHQHLLTTLNIVKLHQLYIYISIIITLIINIYLHQVHQLSTDYVTHLTSPGDGASILVLQTSIHRGVLQQQLTCAALAVARSQVEGRVTAVVAAVGIQVGSLQQEGPQGTAGDPGQE